MSDYYEILGLSREATTQEIKKAYREIALKHHPDKTNNNKESEAVFKKASEAYETLSDPNKKAAYDNGGVGGFGGLGGGFTTGFGFNMEEMFRSHFGGGGFSFNNNTFNNSSKRPQQGSSLECVVEVSLYEVLSGAEKAIDLVYPEPCEACGGTGSEKTEVCEHCGGRGMVQQQLSQGQTRMVRTIPCPICGGVGQRVVTPCGKCQRGQVEVKRQFKFTLPASTNNGTTLRYAGQGVKGIFGGPPGDMHVRIVMVLPDRDKVSKELLEALKGL